MNLKVKAALKTAGLFVAFTAIPVAVAAIASVLTVQQFVGLLAVGVLVITVYNMYRIVLCQLQTENNINEMSGKYIKE
jgi:hypothetical protein